MQIQKKIQVELERLGLASTDSDYGQGGGIDVDFSHKEPGQVKINDSQEQIILDSEKTLAALKKLEEGATPEDFWFIIEKLQIFQAG